MRGETMVKNGGIRGTALGMTLLAVLMISGCDDEERAPQGDVGGVPVTFAVDLQRGYVMEMSSEQWDEPAPFFHPHPYFGGPGPYYHHPAPFGYDDPWFVDEPVDVRLIAGDGPAEANLFRVPLHHGTNLFTVPVRPGRTVTMTVMVRGGREGWEGVGHFTVSDRANQVAHLRLAPEGPSLVVTADGLAAPGMATGTVGGVVGTTGSATAAAPVR